MQICNCEQEHEVGKANRQWALDKSGVILKRPDLKLQCDLL